MVDVVMKEEGEISPSSPLGSLPVHTPTLKQIFAFEQALTKCEDNLNVDDLTSHYFTPGVYAREILIPAGNFIVGKIHKDINMNILTQGKLSVWTEEGMKTLDAPQVIISQPGTKRIGYAWTDTRWICVHGVPVEYNSTEHLDTLENLLIIEAPQDENELVEFIQELDRIKNQPQLVTK